MSTGQGVAVRGYQTDIGPADYVLFVDRKPDGEDIEALRGSYNKFWDTEDEILSRISAIFFG